MAHHGLKPFEFPQEPDLIQGSGAWRSERIGFEFCKTNLIARSLNGTSSEVLDPQTSLMFKVTNVTL